MISYQLIVSTLVSISFPGALFLRADWAGIGHNPHCQYMIFITFLLSNRIINKVVLFQRYSVILWNSSLPVQQVGCSGNIDSIRITDVSFNPTL